MNRKDVISAEIKAIEAKVKILQKRKACLLEELIKGGLDEQSLADARRLYWKTKTGVRKIAWVLNLPGTYFLAQILGPGSTGLACHACGEEYVFPDRKAAGHMALRHHLYKIGEGTLETVICEECRGDLLNSPPEYSQMLQEVKR